MTRIGGYLYVYNMCIYIYVCIYTHIEWESYVMKWTFLGLHCKMEGGKLGN
jgi:hypothetical protein